MRFETCHFIYTLSLYHVIITKFLSDGQATSALDTHTERNILRSFEEICANRTTLVVAHRLSTIIHAHKIMVLDDGVIKECGK